MELELSQVLLLKLPLAKSFIFWELGTAPRLSPPCFQWNAELPRGHEEDICVGFFSRDNIN
jgi:hypothetical protein